ncbi:hypothetical protein KZZ52_36720 [Dactylosporangium sp. AC04546]|uniref:hypothetical protein n=1 Tax=Dactylosporangium sp. AC04546 TaxID=2862460 RepID=UPI001EE0A992|nr:hypothetical protein [Dactylosporangium sp. AC04546]WVK79503.1 hypothetical protein KZZ52_36690 [Dactylosporangium sp. AC04546]WVK79509.1 hypothetical protein KZZ52_36720 [Dactylosporangium sp. AC04546]
MTTRPVDPVLSMALFVSDASATHDLDDTTIRDTVHHTLEQLGPDECYARAAQAFGDHPDTALPRIQWARELAARAYTPALAAA